MARAHEAKLDRLQTTIRDLSTDGEVVRRAHEGAPDYNRRRSLPVNSEDKELLIEFDEELTKYKRSRNHYTLLGEAVAFCRYRAPPTPNSDKASAHGISLKRLLEEPAAAEEFENWVTTLHKENGDRIAPKTESHYRNTIRQFGDLMAEDDRPRHIEDIASTAPRKRKQNNDPTPKRKNILFWEESVVPLLDSSRLHIRDKALPSSTWDSGARPSEMYAMEAGDLTDHGDYIMFEIGDSKTIDRPISLVASMPYLRKWLLQLDKMTDDVDLPTAPYSLPPSQPIWTKQNESSQLTNDSFNRIGRTIGDRLGYTRPTNLKQFRKSRASILAATGDVNQEILRRRFGWKQGSTAPAHYIAQFSDEANQRIAEIDGTSIEITEEQADPTPVPCSNCDHYSPQHLDTCFWCGEEITEDERADRETSKSKLKQFEEGTKESKESKAKIRQAASGIEDGAEAMEFGLRIVEAMESEPQITIDGVVFALMTETDVLTAEQAEELLRNDDTDMQSVLDILE